MKNDYLHPVSFHLRNFGQYQKLDLNAATAGNLTLLGPNGVGKTTLANAFYPVLIDGSIATPNFNPALSSDAVNNNSTSPRNTTRDKRTFNSMLLGWGTSQYQVRTGYTYMTLASSKRQVTLGIGAHRQTDGKKSATWWFVLDSKDTNNFTCCDDNGLALSKDDFRDANASFGEELQLYDTWQAYRGAVARDIYGFDSGEVLGKLTNAYRLLASPILTSGSARFAPIPDALRIAQEPIDREGIIEPLAKSQQNLNQTLALQHELENGLNRLKRIKKAQFWGNLNRLSDPDGLLPLHTKLATQRDEAQAAITGALAKINRLAEQLDDYQDLRDQADERLADLQTKLYAQDSLEQRRDYLDTQIKDWRSQLEIYQHQLIEKDADEQAVTNYQLKLTDLIQDAKSLQVQQLNPVLVHLNGLSANHIELTQALAEIDNDKVLSSLGHYLTLKQRQLTNYQHLSAAILQTNADVELVIGMEQDMGTAIDTRLTGRLKANVNADLHADNRHIHEAGAAAMNEKVKQLQAQQQTLLTNATDLKTFLKDSDFLKKLQSLQDQLDKAMHRFHDNQHDQELAQVQLKAAQAQLDKLITEIDPNFDPAVADTQIGVLTDERNDLQLDPTLTEQVDQQKNKIRGLEATINNLIRQRGEAEGNSRITEKNLCTKYARFDKSRRTVDN
ncbi:hypothetical protein FEZ51_00165 [Pediococcus stilesii]|uniref:Chromosome segregation ATPase n=1 Tax=Pediococcus stilesii TaxID=331679 RepID=A0A5R9BZ53_9LACO|nr:hypothetical protein [Pediococcus stilesii]TLQ05633.1 hypothetical protein FEZ51_00165 [Pediococcus stilesii]